MMDAPGSGTDALRPFVVVLGIAQDAGYPQAGCRAACCRAAWTDPSRRRRVVSLGLVDPLSQQCWLIDASPDFPEQLHLLCGALGSGAPDTALDGLFLTHAHMGHYTGLVHLGREAMNSQALPVYAMPRMTAFLRDSAPWEQLVRLGNIELRGLTASTPVQLSPRLSISAVRVPHRDEYSETVGFEIRGPERAVLWLPDADRWERMFTPIEALIGRVDRAYLDGTFFDHTELPDRNRSEIPHPTIADSITYLGGLPAEVRQRVRFIHLNHTNPALDPTSAACRAIAQAGMGLAREGERLVL